MIGSVFRVGVFQFAPVLGDPEANALRIAHAAAGNEVDLLVTPELALTGYGIGDDAARLALPLEDIPHGLGALEEVEDLIIGLIERDRTGTPMNAAVHLRQGRVLFRHRKLYLPTYGMFDEGRFFGRGNALSAYELGGGWRAGLLICEDFWHPALVYLLAARGIDLLVVQAAGAGRGVWSGSETGGRFASADTWERMARVTAEIYGVYVVLANRVGVEGGVVFAGGSLIIDPRGRILARGPDDAEAVITAELALDEVARARRPWSHIRDDDPWLTHRELTRLLEELP